MPEFPQHPDTRSIPATSGESSSTPAGPPASTFDPRLLLLLLPLLAVALWLWARTPPAIARLLPECDAILYADLRPLRLATHLQDHLPPRSPDYQRFVDQTGIVPERDIDQAAFALTPRPDPSGPNGPVAWTELVSGHFEPARLEQFLRTLAPSTEQYAGHTVFLVPIAPESPQATPRQLRIAVVHPGLVALSNAPTPEQLHQILDKSRSSLFAPAPSLLSSLYPQVPHLSPAWAIGRAGLPFAQPSATNPGSLGPLTLFGLALPIPADQPLVASVRFLGSLRIRVEALTPSSDAALQQSGALSSILGVARTLASAQASKAPAPILQTLNSIHVAPEGNRTILTATLPLDLLRALTTQP